MSSPHPECKLLMGKDYIFVILMSQHLAETTFPIKHATSQPLEALVYKMRGVTLRFKMIR